MPFLALAVCALVLQQPRLDTDTLHAFNRIGDDVRPAGTLIRSVSRAGAVMLISSTFISARGNISYDTVAVDATTLKRLWQRVHAPTDSAAVEYDGIHVLGYSNLANRSARRIDRVLPADVVSSDPYVLENTDWSRGPRTVKSYDIWNDTITTVTYSPLRKDTIAYRGVGTEVWVVQEERADDIVRGRKVIRLLWIDPQRRRLLRRHDRPAHFRQNDGYIQEAR